jgi:hypothetical protein
MAVTINGGGHPPKKKQAPPKQSDRFNAAKFEVYGRLNLNAIQIAQLEGVSQQVVATGLRRADIRAAYYKGRAELTVAIRQKQIAVALAGDTRMLIHAGEKFAGLTEDNDQGVPETFNPTQHSWDGAGRNRMQEIFDYYQSGGKASKRADGDE